MVAVVEVVSYKAEVVRYKEAEGPYRLVSSSHVALLYVSTHGYV
jgi:hypothetical protein